MEYRNAHILKGLVEEYIRTGQPVGSTRLVELLRSDVSSATIRSILRDLEEAGYVLQPHTSAGRTPTDKGYRYYIDHLAFRQPNPQQVQQLAVQLQEYQQQYERPARACAKLLASLARAIAVSRWMRQGDTFEAGLGSFAEYGDESVPAAVREVSALLDDIDDYVERFAQEGEAHVDVFIGEENPVLSAQHISVLVRTALLPHGERAVLLIVGPKRMQYKRNVALLNTMASIIENP